MGRRWQLKAEALIAYMDDIAMAKRVCFVSGLRPQHSVLDLAASITDGDWGLALRLQQAASAVPEGQGACSMQHIHEP